MVAIAQRMGTWPSRAEQPAGTAAPAEQRGPPRPALPSVFCGDALEEMDWTTFRQSVRDPNALGGRRPGRWMGEFHCTARQCGGMHTASGDVAGPPTLWMRVPAPLAALPQCQCGAAALTPILTHSSDAGAATPWQAAWRCFSCGVHSHATVEQALDVSSWLRAADCLSAEQWAAALTAGTAVGFWTSVRDGVAQRVREASRETSGDYGSAGPPEHLAAPTNSSIFVPLLLDAAGLLSADAQRAWMQHAAARDVWENRSQSLRSAPPVSLTALVARLQAKLQRQAQIDSLDGKVCLLWQCAKHIGDPGVSASLPEIVRGSRTDRGYIPGKVQEVLLEAFGSGPLGQAVALLANTLRLGSATRHGAPPSPPAPGQPPSVAAANAAASRSVGGGFVRGADLVTGHGWNRAAAAASEPCDLPAAPSAAAPSVPAPGPASTTVPAPVAAPRATTPGAAQPAAPTLHFHYGSDEAGDNADTTGLTQEVRNMDIDNAPDGPARLDDGDQASSGRRVRRRGPQLGRAWEILRCRMCAGADAFQARDGRGLLLHMVRMHLGQPLNAEAVAQLRHLDKGACRICGTIRARTYPYCSECGCATATRPVQLGDSIPDRRRPPPGTPAPAAPPPAAAPEEGIEDVSVSASPDGTPEAAPQVREVTLSPDVAQDLQHLERPATEVVPVCVASRMATSWTESLHGCMAGNETWAWLARYRSRLLLGPIPEGSDRNTEIKRRLQQWEHGHFDELARTVLGQQIEARRRREHSGSLSRIVEVGDEEERHGRRARLATAQGAVSKAVKGLVGGVASADPAVRAEWTAEYIPRCADGRGPTPSDAEREAARACSWGRGDVAVSRREMRQATRSPEGLPGIPWARLPPHAAPGPSGERQEHLEDILRSCGVSHRRKLRRALDELTVRWAIGALPSTCRWLLNTQVLFLRKQREQVNKDFDDDDWIGILHGDDVEDDEDSDDEAIEGPEWERDVPEERVVQVGSEMEVDAEVAPQPPRPRAQVRPIQMGEFLRKFVSRRLQAVSAKDISRVMTAARQLGVGTSGGAESLAIFQQEVYLLWKAGELPRPLARVKIDQSNFYGRCEWPAIREAVSQHLPRHHAVACWKHEGESYVEQPGVDPAVKDRGAEQGDVDGALESSLTLADTSSKTKHSLHSAQRRGDLPWTAPDHAAQLAASQEFDERLRRIESWSGTDPALRRRDDGMIATDPRHEIQAFGGIADFWYIDDGDILCDPRLVCPLLQSYDTMDAVTGGLRNRTKSDVIYFADSDTLTANSTLWRLDEVRNLASVRTPDESGLTLGVATGTAEAVDAQLERKVQVVTAMHERVAVCNDVQTEHVLCRQSLGVGRVNHILRVHGHELLERGSLTGFDDATRTVMDRLFPGLGPESHEQASLGAALGGLGWRRATDTALPANLGALIMATPKVRTMAAAASHAGLLAPGQVEARIAARIARAEAAYLASLDELERVKAEEFLTKARDAAEHQWQQILSGNGSAGPEAPRAHAEYAGPDELAPSTIPDAQDGGSADPETSSRRLTAPHLQKELSKLRDCTRLRALDGSLRSQCNWAQADRLRELRHKDTSHKWLWHLNSSDGAVMTEADYVLNIQRRLGARILSGPVACGICGAPLDPQLEHSETCATAEATRGHYACVRALVEGFRVADPTVTTEPQGLTSTSDRPADIFTNAAVAGRSAALDVCITSPNAASAGGDAAAAAYRRKLRRYRRAIREMWRAGIAFRPLIWTADARPHPAVVRTLRFAAEIAARRSGSEAPSAAMLGRWRHEITVAVLRRRAAMARAAMPRRSSRQDWLLAGRRVAPATSSGRAAQLDLGESGCEDEAPLLSASDLLAGEVHIEIVDPSGASDVEATDARAGGQVGLGHAAPAGASEDVVMGEDQACDDLGAAA